MLAGPGVADTPVATDDEGRPEQEAESKQKKETGPGGHLASKGPTSAERTSRAQATESVISSDDEQWESAQEMDEGSDGDGHTQEELVARHREALGRSRAGKEESKTSDSEGKEEQGSSGRC